MNAIATPFRQLAAGRLWPIALILALAAVATPLLLADREELPPVPATTTVPAGMNALQAALVSPASTQLEERRRVLGARKDPFTPTGDQPEDPKPQASPAATPAQVSTTASASPASGFDSGSGSGSGSGGVPASDPMTSPSPGAGTSPTPAPDPQPVAPITDDPPARSFALYSLKVRVDGQVRTLKRLDALPNAEAPAAIYLGLHEDGKTAVFLVDEGVSAEGDGRCDPSPQDCQRVFLRKGETEFFTTGGTEDGAQGTELQVDLLSVRTKRTKSAGKARVARMASSSVGRNLLRDRMSRVGRLRYNPRTGLLRELSLDGWRALVARAASRP